MKNNEFSIILNLCVELLNIHRYWIGFIHKKLQVKSSRTLELEYLFVSFVVLWSFSLIFDYVPARLVLLKSCYELCSGNASLILVMYSS